MVSPYFPEHTVVGCVLRTINMIEGRKMKWGQTQNGVCPHFPITFNRGPAGVRPPVDGL